MFYFPLLTGQFEQSTFVPWKLHELELSFNLYCNWIPTLIRGWSQEMQGKKILTPKKNRKETQTNKKTFVRYNWDLIHYFSWENTYSSSFNIFANIHLLWSLQIALLEIGTNSIYCLNIQFILTHFLLCPIFIHFS